MLLAVLLIQLLINHVTFNFIIVISFFILTEHFLPINSLYFDHLMLFQYYHQIIFIVVKLQEFIY